MLTSGSGGWTNRGFDMEISWGNPSGTSRKRKRRIPYENRR